MRIVAVDIGNTRIKAGLFDSEELKGVSYFQSIEEFGEWFHELDEIEHVIIGSVKDLERMGQVIGEQTNLHVAKTSWKTNLNLRYNTLSTLGIDRLAGVEAAWNRFHSACLVIDLGTCMTLDYIDDDGNYWGGNISPGWNMRLKAMHDFTAKLPSVQMDVPDEWLGKNTTEALQNGAFRGMVYEIEGYIQALKQRNERLNVILCGGNAYQFAKYLKLEIFVLPDLILEGLHKLLHANI